MTSRFRRTTGRLAAPYAVAILAVLIEFLAGGWAGLGLPILYWIFHIATGLTFAGWLVVVARAFRSDGLRALVALPSALLFWAITSDIPLLVGGCTIGHECV